MFIRSNSGRKLYTVLYRMRQILIVSDSRPLLLFATLNAPNGSARPFPRGRIPYEHPGMKKIKMSGLKISRDESSR